MARYSEDESSRFVEAGGIRLHYHDVGDGKPVICLHGGGPGAAAWSNFSHNIEALAARFRLLLVDMPQFGKSEKVIVTDEGRLSYTARIIRAFMDELGLDRADFIGNSIGAQSIMKLCIDAPERVGRHVALGNNAAGPLSFFMPRPPEGIKMIVDYYKGEGPTREKMRRLIETLVYDASFLTDEVLEARYRSSAEPAMVDLWTNHHPPREEIADRLHRIAAPTLLVWGSEDRFSPLDSGLIELKLLRSAELHVFPKCGHWAQVERADAFNTLAAEFLSRKD